MPKAAKPKVKKAFDREEMYRKIMPTASREEQDEVAEALGGSTEKEILEINNSKDFEKTVVQNGTALFQNKEIKWISDSAGDVILYNITERLVVNRLEMALKKMSCCRCDRCKKDIVAIALNHLKPHYAVSTSDEIEVLIEKDEKLGLEVTSAILKAILNVRKTPRH